MNAESAHQLHRLVEAAVTAALKATNQNENYSVTVHGGTYTQTNLTLRVELAEIATNGIAMTREMTDLLDYGRRNHIENITREFVHPDIGVVHLIGFSRKAAKYPFICRTSDGKEYRTGRGTINYFLKGSS